MNRRPVSTAAHTSLGVAVIASCLALAACGGGGDDGSAPIAAAPDAGAIGGVPDAGAAPAPAPGPAPTPGPAPAPAPGPGVPVTPSNPAPTTERLTGSLAGMAAANVKVCLDTNRSFGCDATEPSGVTAPDGRFSFAVPLGTASGGMLVAEVPQGERLGLPDLGRNTPLDAFVLAAPAKDGTALGAMTTLVATRMARTPGLTAAQAEAAIKTATKLPANVDLSAGPGAAANAGLMAIEQAALPALRAASAAARSATNPAGALGVVAGPLEQALARYVDASTGRLLQTVGARTLINETTHSATRATTCATTPIARVTIETANRAPVTSRDSYIAAQVTIDSGDTSIPQFQAPARIRGRGNSTWTLLEKKPYRLNLNTAASVLGMPADRDWALLANHSDKTMLRNATAFCMSQMLGMDYTPRSRFVEITLNGDYVGVYQFTEHQKAAPHRVDIGRAPEGSTDPAPSFFLEIDERLDEVLNWYSGQRIPYTVKNDATPALRDAYKAHIERMEQALMGANYRDPVEGYATIMDVESLVDLYLINELMRNQDAFFSSTYVHRRGTGKVQFGPAWDFDIAAGNVDYSDNWRTQGWWVRNRSVYVRRALTDPAFQQHLVARWQYLNGRMGELQSYIDRSASNLDDAQRRNFVRWPVLGVDIWPNYVALPTYAGEVNYLKNWLTQRATWMDTEIRRPTP